MSQPDNNVKLIDDEILEEEMLSGGLFGRLQRGTEKGPLSLLTDCGEDMYGDCCVKPLEIESEELDLDDSLISLFAEIISDIAEQEGVPMTTEDARTIAGNPRIAHNVHVSYISASGDIGSRLVDAIKEHIEDREYRMA